MVVSGLRYVFNLCAKRQGTIYIVTPMAVLLQWHYAHTTALYISPIQQHQIEADDISIVYAKIVGLCMVTD
jgi:hypothetical protein